MKKKSNFLTVIATFCVFAILVHSCKKNDDDNNPSNTVAGAPTLTTIDATNISAVSADIGGTISGIGECAILKHGIVISTGHNPTINNINFIDNTITGTGAFSISASTLLPSTTYYARAFATNCKGTNYGNEIQFTTLGGGGNSDYYISYTVDDSTYLCSGVGSTIITGPDGNRIGTCAVPSGMFILGGVSTNFSDETKANGFNFNIQSTDVNGVGTFTSNGSTGSTVEISTCTFRLGVGPFEPFPTYTNWIQYENVVNVARVHNGNDCDETTLPIATQTIIITQWAANANDVMIGSFSGTFYENLHAAVNCTTSEPHTYSGSFKLKRTY